MIASCPACESRFKIDPDRVPVGGRQVRCGKCGHVWRIAADGSPMVAGNPPEPAVEDAPPGTTFGRRAPPVGEASMQASSNHPADPVQDGNSQPAADAGNDLGPVPPLLGSAMTPNARQKLAEARKGKSRVRFLVIALVLMIVAAAAVSLIGRSGGLNETLRMVPGLDDSSPVSNFPDEPAGDNAQ